MADWAIGWCRPINNDFAPRIGITYSPDSKWVIRAGAGMFYNQDTGNPRFDMARNLAGRVRVNSDLPNPTLFWSNALSSFSGAVAQVPLPYAFANKYDRRTPYSLEYLLNVQRELSNNWIVEAVISARSASTSSCCARSTNRCPERSAPRKAGRRIRNSAAFNWWTTRRTAITTR